MAYSNSPRKILEVADGLYKLGPKKSLYWGLYGTLITIIIWHLNQIPYIHSVNVKIILKVIASLTGLFSVPLLIYGILGLIGKRFPRFFLISTFFGFAYFIYVILNIAYTIYQKHGDYYIMIMPIILILGLETLIIIKLLKR